MSRPHTASRGYKSRARRAAVTARNAAARAARSPSEQLRKLNREDAGNAVRERERLALQGATP